MDKKNKLSEEDKALFREAVKNTRPIAKDKVYFEKAKKTPAERRRSLQEASLSRAPKPVSAAEPIQFARSGIQHRIQRKLSQGLFPIENKLDLHGQTTEEAHRSLHDFLVDNINQDNKCVLIVHGKGGRTEGSVPILKNQVNNWLREWRDVLAFVSAQPKHGGTGAVYVLLKSRLG